MFRYRRWRSTDSGCAQVQSTPSLQSSMSCLGSTVQSLWPTIRGEQFSGKPHEGGWVLTLVTRWHVLATLHCLPRDTDTSIVIKLRAGIVYYAYTLMVNQSSILSHTLFLYLSRMALYLRQYWGALDPIPGARLLWILTNLTESVISCCCELVLNTHSASSPSCQQVNNIS